MSTPDALPARIACATLTVPEVALRLGISRGLAYEMVRDGRIPSLRLGRKRLVVSRAVIDAMLAPELPGEA